MPWKTTADVRRHNKAAAKSPVKSKVFKKVANRILEQTGDEGRAIREGNAAADRVHKRGGWA